LNIPQQNTIPPKKKKKTGSFKIRQRILQWGLLGLFLLVVSRLFQIQVIDASEYRDIAQKQYQSKISLPASRGTLLDHAGKVIASNTNCVSFVADPQIASDDANAIAIAFSKVFGRSKRYYLDTLATDSRFVWLERQVSIDYLKKLDVKKLPGVFVHYEPKRVYHHDQVAGQLIGTTNRDNEGIAGIELEFNKELRGIDGYVIFQRDGKGRARPVVDYPRVEPQNGHSIILTLDLSLQSILEEELARGITQNKAESGLAIILDPHTGAVFAIAQNPPVNPNVFSASDVKDQKLRAVTDLFEPGSVFKLVTTSAAIEDNLIKPDQMFYAEEGTYRVAGRQHPIKDTHEYGWLSFKEAMALSSNIVMAKASDIIGPERFYRMARNYGFGIQTNIELPGEVRGNLKKPIDWSAPSLNTMAYGYEVGVTPIQIAQAYAALANGGVMMKPYIFEKELDENGNIVRQNGPQMIRRVVSESTVRTIKDFLVEVVETGTAKNIKMANLKIAGKTGTSKKFVEGHYETGKYTASFVGFFPADDPKLVCLVMMDNPSAGTYYGGTTSAPIFKAVAERVINTTEMFAPATAAPVMVQKNVEAPKSIAQKDETSSVHQTIPKDTAIAMSSPVTDSARAVVPDVTGFTARKAITLLTADRFQPILNGSGIVVSQSPQPGTPASAGKKIVLFCKPRSLTLQ
jgi:cell division protein FtsI (penicillin-binding protein 3)